MSPLLCLGADIKGTIYINTEKAGKVPFEHETHLQNLQSNCSVCHNSIFHVMHKKNPVYTMADMEKGKSCGACHNKDKPGSTQLNNCTRCHPVGDVPINIPDFGTLLFSHGKHLGMYTCTDCHDSLFKATRENVHISMAQMERGKGCGACHDGKTAFSVKGDCIKCHQVGNIKMAAGSLFSHNIHIEMPYRCDECHNKLYVPGPNRKHDTMRDMELGKSCGVCHDGKTAFSVKGDCQKCHQNISNINFKAFGALFSHPAHTKLFKCSDCHSSIFIGGAYSERFNMPQMEQGKSCGACHDGKTAFGVTSNCAKCHSDPPAVFTFKIKNAGIVNFSHISHKSLYSCGDCHNAILGTGVAAKRYSMADMEKGKSCGACHDDKTAFGVKKGCGKCHPVKEIQFADDARFNHERHLGGLYSCSDCHNALFNAGPDNKRFTMSQMENGDSCGACHESKTAFSVKGDCDKCHRSTVNIVFKVKEAGDTIFSHKLHGELYKCADCHNGIFMTGKARKNFTMSDMEKGLSCGACHDGKSAFGLKDGCVRCHPVKQINFKPGSAMFSHTVHIAAYSCKDCHPDLFVPGPGNLHTTMAQMEKGQSCGACHDDKTAFGVKTNCQKCHPGNPKTTRYELPANTGSVDFNHKVHQEKGYGCNDCHYSVVASGNSDKRWVMKEMDQGNFCGACHGLSMAFSVKDPLACERCHQKESDWRPQPLL